MLRSIGAVLAGFVVFTILSLGADAALRAAAPASFSATGRVDDVGLLVLIVGYVAVFMVMGAYTTARTVRTRPMMHALVLGAIALLFSIGAAAALWDTAPAWYHAAQLLLMMPAAWFGGRLREREIARHAPHGRTIPAT